MFTPIELLAEGSYDMDAASLATGIAFDPEEDMAQQQFKDESDINKLIARFLRTGEMPPPRAPGAYGDFTQVTDFQSAMEQLRAARSAFMELPAELRAEFENDPAQLLEFVQDDSNYDEAVELGLVPPRPKAPGEPVVVPPAPDPG